MKQDIEQDGYEIFTRAHRVYIRGIRNGITERLQSAYGADWWERGVLSAVGENQREYLALDVEKGISENLANLLDTTHFGRIVAGNHAVAFADAFPNIDNTQGLLRYLGAMRNRWAHVHDSQWTAPDVMSAVQAMREILISLRRREALEIHQMFRDSLDQQGSIPAEALNAPEETTAPEDDDAFSDTERSLLGFWRALESYLAVESAVSLDAENEARSTVVVRVTNTAPVSEGRPDIRFSDVGLEISGTDNLDRRRENRNLDRRRENRMDLGDLKPGQTVERQFTVPSKGLASVEFHVYGDVDQHRLFRVRQRNTLPEEVVTPLLEEINSQFEAVGIEEALAEVMETVARIQPDMTLAEVSALRGELAQLRPLIAEKRGALQAIFREYRLAEESPLGTPLREVIASLDDLERNKISAMDDAIGQTDLESIRSVAHDFEQLQISALRARQTIRERLLSRRA